MITMKVINSVNDEVECVLTKDQILMIKNCLGEICFGIDLAEFQTRVGYTRDEVGEFVKQLKQITNNLGIEE
jgi:hypothetical protein